MLLLLMVDFVTHLHLIIPNKILALKSWSQYSWKLVSATNEILSDIERVTYSCIKNWIMWNTSYYLRPKLFCKYRNENMSLLTNRTTNNNSTFCIFVFYLLNQLDNLLWSVIMLISFKILVSQQLRFENILKNERSIDQNKLKWWWK